MKPFLRRLSLSQQFLQVSLPIPPAGSVATGWWAGRPVEASTVHRIGGASDIRSAPAQGTRLPVTLPPHAHVREAA